MKVFGSPILNADLVQRVDTPVGAMCGHCKEPIAAGDDGWVLPYCGGPEEPRELTFHHACHLRSVIGSVAHQQGRCSCFVPGSLAEDDPALTRRQAAEAALHYYHHGRARG